MKARMGVTLGGVALMAGGALVCRPAVEHVYPMLVGAAHALTLSTTGPAISADTAALTRAYNALRGDTALGQAPVPEGAGAALLGLLVAASAIGGGIGQRRARREVERAARKSLVRSAAKERIDPEKQQERALVAAREAERLVTLRGEGWFTPNNGGWYLGTEKATGKPLYLPRAIQAEHPLVNGGTGSGKCVALDTLVWSSGLREFGEVWGSDRIHGPFTVDHVSDWYDDGTRDGYRIETEMGLHIDGTSEHRMWIRDESGYEGWCKLKDINTNAYVAVGRGMADWGDNDMPLDEAYLLGLVIADGCFATTTEKNGTIRDHLDVGKHPIVLERIAPVMQRWREAVRRNYHGDFVKMYPLSPVYANCSISGIGLHAYLQESYGLTPLHSYDKVVPTKVLQGTRQVVQSFLRGYFDGDGYCDGQIEVSTASPVLAAHVQQLLIGLGVYASIRTKPTSRRLAHIVCVRDTDAFAREVGFTHYGLTKDTSFSRLLERPRNTNTDTVPGMAALMRAGRSSLTLSKRDSTNPWWSVKRFWKQGQRPKPSYKTLRQLSSYLPAGNVLREFERIIEENRIWTRVIAITPSTQHRIDCTVDGSHSFIGNGLINHNTARLLVPWLFGEAMLPAEKRASLIIVDPKDGGEICKRTIGVMRAAGYRCLVYDPYAVGSVRFNAAAVYEDPEGVETMVETWVRSLGDFHPHFGALTVALVTGVLLYLRDVEKETPNGDWRRVSMGDMATWNRTHSAVETAEIIVAHAARKRADGQGDPIIDGVARQMDDLIQSKQSQANVMGGVRLRMKCLNNPRVMASMAGNDIDWEEFVRVPTILYMAIDLGTARSIGPVIVTGLTATKDALSQVASRHNPTQPTLPRPVRSITDEAVNIGKIAGLPAIVSTARSINYGLAFATQGPKDIKREYGEEGDRVMTSLLTHIVLAQSNDEDLEHYTDAQAGVTLDDLKERNGAYIKRAGLRPTYVQTRLWFRDKRLVALVKAAGPYSKADALREQLAQQQAGMNRVEADAPATIDITTPKTEKGRRQARRPIDITISENEREKGAGDVDDRNEVVWGEGELAEAHALAWD